MKSTANILLLLCVIILTSACNGRSGFRLRLSTLDSALISNPDSVYHILVNMEKETEGQSYEDRMYYNLLCADAQNKAYIDFTTDSAMLEVADYFDNHGSSNEQMRAHYLLGCTYRDLKDVPMELQCFQEAVEKADTTNKDCDLYTLASIYGQMADIYHSQYLPQEELKALSMCEVISMKDGDTFSAIKAYELRLRAYNILDMPDSVLSISKTARERYISIGDTVEAAHLLAPAITILIDRNKYRDAYEYMKLFENTPLYKDSSGKIRKRYVHYLYNKGRYELHCNEIEKARKSFHTLLEHGKTQAAYSGLMALYRKINQQDSLAKYAELYVQANDLNHAQNISEFIEQMTASNNYSRQEQVAKKNLLEKNKEKEKNLVLIIVLISFIFAISVISILAINHYKKVKLEHSRKEDILYRSYNNTLEKIKSLEQERAKFLSLQNTHEENITTLKLLHQEIEEYKKEKECLIEKLEHLGNSKKEIDFKAWLEKFQQNPAFSNLWEKLIKVKPNDNKPISHQAWKNIYNLFMKECPRFMSFLECPDKELIDVDKKIIMLCVGGFNTGDVAILLGKSKQQISNIHNRIKTKLYPDLENTHHLKKELLTTLWNTLE